MIFLGDYLMTTNFKVLHLDDNPVFLNMTKSLFENQKDINYEGVFSTKEAFSSIENRIPDLVLVDLMLEDQENPEPGVQFIEQVSKRYPKTCMFVLTSYKENNIKEKISKYVREYFQKGCDPQFFISTVIRYLKQE